MEADYHSEGWLVLKWHLQTNTAQAAFHLQGQPELDLLASSCTNQYQHFYILESPLPVGTFSFEFFSHPWMYQMSYVFPSPSLVPLVLYHFLAECITGQFILLILVAPFWMEAPWLPMAVNMLADVPYQCPIIKDFIMDVSVGWLLRDACYADKGSLPWSVRQ